MTDKELLEIASVTKDNAYAPYSSFKVGAALLCQNGEVITGCNVENVSYGATICAERTAFVKAVSMGKKNFKKIAISVSGLEIGLPCGMCLQVISEFVDDDFEVICGNAENIFEVYKFSQLLPHSFHAKEVKKLKRF